MPGSARAYAELPLRGALSYNICCNAGVTIELVCNCAVQCADGSIPIEGISMAVYEAGGYSTKELRRVGGEVGGRARPCAGGGGGWW